MNRRKEKPMITVLRGGQVFSPACLGNKDILIVHDRIGAMASPGEIRISGTKVQEIDVSKKIIIPGFIDSHVHILGGGGEGGPTTRAPEICIEDIISSGVTALIGCLGVDGITRQLPSLLAKARALEFEGITTCIFSGSYEIPANTLTGSIRSDLIMVDKVIGAGEIAISDHRSSQPTFDEFARLAADCRIGGMLGGKAGILHCHLGDGKDKLDLIFRLVKETEIPPAQVIPTHSNRNRDLLEEAIRFMHLGGYIDLTADPDPEPKPNGHVSVAVAIQHCREKQAPITQITISSDSNGSLPVFDPQGKLLSLTIATQKSLLTNFQYLVSKDIVTLEEAVMLFSTNPAVYYGLDDLGEIKTGKQADILLLDKDYHLTGSFAKGKIMMLEGKLLVKGTFSS